MALSTGENRVTWRKNPEACVGIPPCLTKYQSANAYDKNPWNRKKEQFLRNFWGVVRWIVPRLTHWSLEVRPPGGTSVSTKGHSEESPRWTHLEKWAKLVAEKGPQDQVYKSFWKLQKDQPLTVTYLLAKYSTRFKRNTNGPKQYKIHNVQSTHSKLSRNKTGAYI